MASAQDPFEEWLPEVAADPLLIDGDGDGLDREARHNCWSFSLTSEQASALTPEAVMRFVDAVQNARERQISDASDGGHPMWMYVWTSEMHPALRLCLISVSHGRLPFGGPIEPTDDLRGIAARFLANSYHDGIPMEEFRAVTEEDLLAEEEPEPGWEPFPVWLCRLPREA